jgi:hypothetical protein
MSLRTESWLARVSQLLTLNFQFLTLKCLPLPRKNLKKMIRNTDKRHAGDAPAAADGTVAGAFGSCRAGALLLTRR